MSENDSSDSAEPRKATTEVENHFYPRVLNAHIHPSVRYFLGLGSERMAERYCRRNPAVEVDTVRRVLYTPPKYFRWGGADLFHVTNDDGVRRLVVLETNSCPSGQKSMPRLEEDREWAGYQKLLERTFVPMLRRRALPRGDLAVLYDKNPMEVKGYAAVLSEATGEHVHLVPCYDEAPEPRIRCEAGNLDVRDDGGSWHPIRAAFRYVTQRPWNRIPPLTRAAMLNPVLVCLAGGRNKLLAAKAYDFYNAELYGTGLRIAIPETIRDVALEEVPLWVARMGGAAVVKNPYTNAGQGVYTIVSQEELDAFMGTPHRYDRFIVQALLGDRRWSSRTAGGRLYHVGSIPDRRGRIYVFDLRFMVGAGPEGYYPLAIYARRAREPLPEEAATGTDSWSVLGTNLSVRRPDGQWDTESDRLLLMDSRDFNRLGLGVDDLIEAYVQTVLAVNAIDRMACALVNSKGRFRRRFFQTLNPDPVLAKEIMTDEGIR